MKTYKTCLKVLIRIFYFVILVAFAVPVFSKDLGVIGDIYNIQEEDFLDFIQRRLLEIQQNGQWDNLKKEVNARVAKHADRPKPNYLPRTLHAKSWDYDPSIIAPNDLKDNQGNIFAKAGTTINPLNYVSLKKALVFYDSDDEKQIRWAEEKYRKLEGKVKLILVNGSVVSQAQLFHEPIYFDQEGKLIDKFQIEHVPALIVQNGEKLKITEEIP